MICRLSSGRIGLLQFRYYKRVVLKSDTVIQKWQERQIKSIDRCYLDLAVKGLRCSNCLSDSATNCVTL